VRIWNGSTAHSSTAVLQQHNWSGRLAAARSEFVGLCPLQTKTTPPSSSPPQKSVLLPRLRAGWRLDSLCRTVAPSSLFARASPISKKNSPHRATVAHTAGFYQLDLHRIRKASVSRGARSARCQAHRGTSASAMPPAATCALTCRPSATSLERLLEAGLIGRRDR